MGKFTILESFSMERWGEMDAFIADTHGERHVLRNRELFEWFFVRNGTSEKANLIVAYHDQELVSLLGYIPTVFSLEGESIRGAWMAHWMTKAEYRTGIGALLMRKITEMFPIAAGQGASVMNERIVKMMGFEFRQSIPKVVFLFNPERTIGPLAHAGRSTLPLADLCSPVENCTIALREDEYCPDWQNYPAVAYATLRDASYINHRYIDYPFFHYHVMRRGSATRPSLSVSRLVDARDDTGRPLFRVGRVLEFLFPETATGQQEAREHLSDLLHYLREQGCDYVDFYCTNERYIAFFLENGFVLDSNGDLPSLLDPVDDRKKFQNLEIYLSPSLREKYPRALSTFYVTRADGDQDRPNNSFAGRVKWGPT